jgi:hypothetical protein
LGDKLCPVEPHTSPPEEEAKSGANSGAGSHPDLARNCWVSEGMSPDVASRQVTEKHVEQRNPAAPSDGPRVTQRAIDIVRPGSGSVTQETQTIQILDASHNWEVVSIDTRKADNSAIQVDVAAPDKPK